MTIASRHFTATPRAQRSALARFGTVGSLVVWALTLAGAPFYIIIALIFGVTYSIVDRMRAIGRAGSDAVEQALGHAMPVADNLGSLLGRLRTGLDGALGTLIDRRSDRLVISLPRATAFPDGAATPSSGARDLLARLARAVEAGTWRIDVIGYGDAATGDPAARSDAGSIELSSRRAQAAVDALRAAGCRGPIAVLGASTGAGAGGSAAASMVPREPAALDIVIRGGERRTKDAA